MVSENNIIKINGTDYSPDDLNQEQNYMISQVRDLQAKTAQARFNLDQLQVSLNHFTNKLIESIKNVEDNDASKVMPKQSIN